MESMIKTQNLTTIFLYFFPADQLHIMDYNRLVKDLNGLTKKRNFWNKIQKNFTVTKVNRQYKPDTIHTFGMYLDKKV